ncbi:MAG: RHS repeat-associated core domain-containing protein [Thermogutta sp.]|uniref:RHS repeat-associated core domain-containing protein n=1 Tax=Thermogutta sp. TaxID=1962930 RepID=UPI0019CB0906|nr:RHS repeat-associated core domain-containing protein [Thermogutta sp.]MBC7350991.1 RHS repeat-associated core domain-containing protein [Thermogutta sp.]
MDHLNTVRDIAKYDPGSDMTTVVNHLIYDAFGQVTSESNPTIDSLFLFTGRPFDSDTQLQNNLNRWYDASVGRWLSEDPIGSAGADANLYRYVGNGVILRGDRLGVITPGTNHILLPGGSQCVYGGHWTWDDFLLHYMLGGGEVTLAQIGLDDTFWNSPDVQRSQQDFVHKFVSILHGAMRGVDCDITSFPWWYHDTDVANSTFVIYPHGRSTFFRRVLCEVNVKTGHECCANKNRPAIEYSAKCKLTFEIKDKFADPLDVEERFGIKFEFGHVYRIVWRHDYGIYVRGSTCEEAPVVIATTLDRLISTGR